MTKKFIYIKPIAIEITTDRKRYMAGGGGYVSNKSIAPYKVFGNVENKNILNDKAITK